MSEVGGKRILVLGIGNADRGDDGIGPLVIEALAGRLPQEVELQVRSGDLLALIDDWAGFERVIIIDAAQCLDAPGRVHRVDALHEPLPLPASPASSHAFGLPEALALAQTLGGAPAGVTAYAVEGEDFAAGAAVTPKVRAAVPVVTDRVVREVHRVLGGRVEAKSHA